MPLHSINDGNGPQSLALQSPPAAAGSGGIICEGTELTKERGWDPAEPLSGRIKITKGAEKESDVEKALLQLLIALFEKKSGL